MNELGYVCHTDNGEERQLVIDCPQRVACSLIVYVLSCSLPQSLVWRDHFSLLPGTLHPLLVNCNVSALAFILIGITCLKVFVCLTFCSVFVLAAPVLVGIVVFVSFRDHVSGSHCLVFLYGRLWWQPWLSTDTNSAKNWSSTDTNRAKIGQFGRTVHQDWDAYVKHHAKSQNVIVWLAISTKDWPFASYVSTGKEEFGSLTQP